jgi:hypothetical protein
MATRDNNGIRINYGGWRLEAGLKPTIDTEISCAMRRVSGLSLPEVEKCTRVDKQKKITENRQAAV